MVNIDKYKSKKMALLEDDFVIHLNSYDHMRMTNATTQFEIDNLMREIFNKYL